MKSHITCITARLMVGKVQCCEWSTRVVCECGPQVQSMGPDVGRVVLVSVYIKYVIIDYTICTVKFVMNFIFQNYIYLPIKFDLDHSTEHAIVEITDNLKKAIDKNLYTCGVFLDFSKAFDTVNHQILLKKLEALRYKRNSLTMVY